MTSAGVPISSNSGLANNTPTKIIKIPPMIEMAMDV